VDYFNRSGYPIILFYRKDCLYTWTIKILWLPTTFPSLLGMRLNERSGSSQPVLVRIIPLNKTSSKGSFTLRKHSLFGVSFFDDFDVAGSDPGFVGIPYWVQLLLKLSCSFLTLERGYRMEKKIMENTCKTIYSIFNLLKKKFRRAL